MINIFAKKQPVDKPPKFLIIKAIEFWGKEIIKNNWKKVKLGPEYNKHHGERSFICNDTNACEMVQIQLVRHQDTGDETIYGLGKCLSCERIYWGEVGGEKISG